MKHNKNTSPSRRAGLLRKIGVGLALTAVAGAGAEAYIAYDNAQQKKFEQLQDEIGPTIKAAMIDIDNQAIAEHEAHPDKVLEVESKDGRSFDYYATTGNVRITMGQTNGHPDPNKPLYISYRNNTGTGPGTRGTQVLFTAPEGNRLLDEIAWSGYGGTTGGGWGAAIPGTYDTTSRGYAGAGPAPGESARKAAEIAQDLRPFDPYR